MRMDIAFWEKGGKMPIVDIKDLPDFKTVNLVDLTEDSINKIAEAVVSKLSKSVKHGYWIFNPKDAIEMMFTLPKCSECGAESPNGGNYCPNCGTKMDKSIEDYYSTF